MLLREEAYCPNNCSEKQWLATAHVTELWIIDSRGDFVDDATTHGLVYPDSSVTHAPDSEDVWTCTTCNSEAKFRKVVQ